MANKYDCSRLDPFFLKLLKTSPLLVFGLVVSSEHLKVIYLQSPKACQQNHHIYHILSAFHSLMAPENQRKQNPDQNFLPIPGLFDISLEKCWRDSRCNCTFIWCSLGTVASCVLVPERWHSARCYKVQCLHGSDTPRRSDSRSNMLAQQMLPWKGLLEKKTDIPALIRQMDKLKATIIIPQVRRWMETRPG